MRPLASIAICLFGACSIDEHEEVEHTASVTGGTVLNARIAHSANDAEESATGSVTLSSSDLELVTESSTQTVGLRFVNITIPRGASITAAYIQFTTDETSSTTTALTLRGQAHDNAPAFTTASKNISARPRTTAAVNWAPPAWGSAGEAGSAQRTPSLVSIVQELVDRPSWASGNAMAFVITGTGKRVAEAVDGVPSAAPLLHVEYISTSDGSTTTTNPDPDFTSCNLVTDTNTKAMPSLAKPGYLQSVIDPVFGTKITRIAGDPGTPIPNTSLTWGNIARHHYSKDQPWSADQALLFLSKGIGGVLFLDGTSYQVLFSRSSPGEFRWHPTLADTMIYLSSSCDFGVWNVRTNTKTVVFKPSGYTSCKMGPYEGNLSYDGNRVVAAGTRSSDGKLVAFAVDLQSKQKYPDIDLAAAGLSYLGWASSSASGNYVVVHGTINGGADSTIVYDLGGVKIGATWSEYGRPSHFDLGFDNNGREVAVGTDKAGNKGRVIMRRLTDGVATVLNSGGYSSHTSTRNDKRPGWAYVTTPQRDSYPPFSNEAYAVKLDGSLRVQRYGHVRTTKRQYEAEPHVVASHDGRRMIFASDWMNSSGPIQAYVIDIAPRCP